MSSDPRAMRTPRHRPGRTSVSMPRPTVAPLVLSLGLALLAAGVVTSPAFLVVGGLILVAGLCLWVAQLLPGVGTFTSPWSSRR